jgi:EAL domain-containing protein (putative c-di-GMP-specific phosphodiesterase class I)
MPAPADSPRPGKPSPDSRTPRRPTGSLRALQPQRDMHNALRGDELLLHYQPIVDLISFEVTGVEALLRWQHPEGKLLTPDEFLPGVVQAPVMRRITRRALQLACRDAVRWPDLSVSVNAAASDVVNERFVDDVVKAVESSGLDARRLTLELTEQSVVQDLGLASEHLRRLRDIGVRVALDDFGTGYSSLLYLRELPVTQVKVDRRFVAALETAEEDAAIVESVVQLARKMGLDVVAEGVETEHQVALLQALHCRAAQGYLFAPPRPPHEVVVEADPVWSGLGLLSRRRARTVTQRTADDRTIAQVSAMLAGGASLHTIAAALNRSGSTTAAGTRWSARSVAGLVAGRAGNAGGSLDPGQGPN